MSKRTKKKPKTISSKKTQKIPKNLLEISVKKSINQSNYLITNYYNQCLALINLKLKHSNFDMITTNRTQLFTDFYNYDFYNYMNELVVTNSIYNNELTVIYPLPKKEFIDILNNLLKNYEIKQKRFIIIPLHLLYIQNYTISHANILMIDLKKRRAEYFEPHGGVYSNIKIIKNQTTLIKLSKKLIKELQILFKKMKVELVLPHDYLKKQDFQSIESYIEPYIDHKSSVRKKDLNGYCLVWSLWFASLRLKFPETDLKKLVDKARNIIESEYKFKNFIRNYSKDIYKQNNKLIKKNIKKIPQLVEKHFTIYK